MTAPVETAVVDFAHPVEPRVDRRLQAVVTASGTANGLRITGTAHLGPGLDLGATNAINGDKILRLETPLRVRASERIAGRLAYVMGGGLGSVRWTWED